MTVQKYEKILVPVDGSKSAEKALMKAIDIVKRNGGHLDILNVIDLKQFSSSFGGMMDLSGDIIYQTFEDVQKYLDELENTVKENGVDDVAVHARYGSPKTIIANDFVNDHKIQLIVMGSTGLNVVERMLVGSVTDYVVRTAKCDVIIAK